MPEQQSIREPEVYDSTSRTLFKGLDRSIIDVSKVEDSLSSIDSSLTDLSEEFKEVIAEF